MACKCLSIRVEGGEYIAVVFRDGKAQFIKQYKKLTVSTIRRIQLALFGNTKRNVGVFFLPDGIEVTWFQNADGTI